MSSLELQKAREYEARADREIRPEDRPVFHLTPRIGWMNDPNGFSYYNGQYHLFYQYHPYKTFWGPMHWGHAVSKDLLHWEYLPAALAPDTASDKDGCFSGCALTTLDGRHELIYTGVVNEEQEDGETRGVQTQCIAFGDGLNYAKSDRNPLLSHADLPAAISRYDCRDPKAWREDDGTYRMLCAARTADESDTLYLLFCSTDAVHWRYERELLRNSSLMRPIGRMYECPDYFPLDGQQVLLASAQDMEGNEEYACGNGTFAMIGSYDAATGEYAPESDQNVDYGLDFYAEQTVLAPDGRRIMLAWMQNWDTLMVRPENCKWFGQITVPRELSIHNGRLYQMPIRELQDLRRNRVQYHEVAIGGGTDAGEPVELEGVRGRIADLEIAVRLGGDAPAGRQFTIRVAVDAQHHTDIIYRAAESLLTVDRRCSGTRRAMAHVSSAVVEPQDGVLKLRIILDRFSVEVFVNDGEKALSTAIYTEQSADRITFSAMGAVTMDVVKYDLVM